MLILSIEAGWEFLIAGILFFIVVEKIYPEHLLLGAVFDSVFGFPPFFFTGIILFLMFLASISSRFFKSDTIFNYLAKGFLLSLAVFLISSTVFVSSFAEEFWHMARFGALAFAKIFISLCVFIVLFKIKELLHGPSTRFAQ